MALDTSFHKTGETLDLPDYFFKKNIVRRENRFLSMLSHTISVMCTIVYAVCLFLIMIYLCLFVINNYILKQEPKYTIELHPFFIIMFLLMNVVFVVGLIFGSL